MEFFRDELFFPNRLVLFLEGHNFLLYKLYLRQILIITLNLPLMMIPFRLRLLFLIKQLLYVLVYLYLIHIALYVSWCVLGMLPVILFWFWFVAAIWVVAVFVFADQLGIEVALIWKHSIYLHAQLLQQLPFVVIVENNRILNVLQDQPTLLFDFIHSTWGP